MDYDTPIETKMDGAASQGAGLSGLSGTVAATTTPDPLLAAFDPPKPQEETPAEPSPLEQQVQRMQRWMDAHTVAAARPVLAGSAGAPWRRNRPLPSAICGAAR